MISRSECPAVISRFLSRQNILSLATSVAEDVWCANCFYVFDEQDMALYVMTELSTLHGTMMAANPRVSGTIAHQTRTVARIQGVQFRGCIRCLEDGDEAGARALYCQHFPVAKMASAPIWKLALLEIKMTNNALGFGHKTLWLRGDEQA